MTKVEIPEFDRGKYLRTEIKNSKLIMLSAAAGAISGVAAGLLQVSGMGYLSVIFLILALAYLFTKTDLARSKTMTKVSAAYLVIMIFLGMWAVSANPPIMDVVPPKVDGVYYWNGTAWVKYAGSIELNTSYAKVKIVVVDNGKITSVSVSGDIQDVQKRWVKDNLVEIIGKIGRGGHNIKIVAYDSEGHRCSKTLTLNF